jgi:cytochrome P450
MNSTAPLPPGPRGQFLTGSLTEFHKDILGFYSRCAREYGDVFSFRLGRRRLVMLTHPDYIERVLIHDNKNFAKMTYVLRLIVPLLGQGLLTSDGDLWLRQRRLIQPVFSKQRLASYAGCMVDYAQRLAATWRDGEVRDIYGDMVRLTLEIVAKVLFDADVARDAPEVGQALTVVMHNFLNRWGSLLPLPAWFPTPGNLRFHHSIRRLDKIIYRFIAERRASGQERNDLLSLLLHARDEDSGGQMTDRQLRDEAMTLFLAGHETTANAMSFTWYLLAQHPEVEAKVLDELRRELGGRPPMADDMPRLKYAESVILESMRLLPPAYGFGRIAKQDCEFGGYRIPAGTTVLVSQWVTQRDPRFWPDAEKFRPERWQEPAIKQLPKFAYFPFGGGPRLCIGNTFAMMETILLLATLAPHAHFDLVPDHPFKLRPAVTLKPEFGIKVTVRKR